MRRSESILHSLLVITILLDTCQLGSGTCSKKVDHCQKLKIKSGYKGPLKPTDPLLMLRRPDNHKLSDVCRSQDTMRKVIRCMGRALSSRACTTDFFYSKVAKYFDGNRTVSGMEYFCQHYKVVQSADTCMKLPNEELKFCRGQFMADMGTKIQHRQVDNSLICRARVARRDCVKNHLKTTCGPEVVNVLTKTMERAIPSLCDQYFIIDPTDSATTAINSFLVTLVAGIVQWIISK